MIEERKSSGNSTVWVQPEGQCPLQSTELSGQEGLGHGMHTVRRAVMRPGREDSQVSEDQLLKVKLQLKYFFQVGRRHQNIQRINTEETAGARVGPTSGHCKAPHWCYSPCFSSCLGSREMNRSEAPASSFLTPDASEGGLKLPGNFRSKRPSTWPRSWLSDLS